MVQYSKNKIIEEYLKKLTLDPYKNKKRILEILQTEKFLDLLNNNFHIENPYNEAPDFIISNEVIKVGIEHELIIDQQSKEVEGYFQTICDLVEKKLREDGDIPNILVNIFFQDHINRKGNAKQDHINRIYTIAREFILNNSIPKNNLIEDISKMDHSQININANLGAWFQKFLTEDILLRAINKKENKIDNYISNTKLEQWLLLVIGGVGESSYVFEDRFEPTINSRFKKIYLLEDFSSKIYELK